MSETTRVRRRAAGLCARCDRVPSESYACRACVIKNRVHVNASKRRRIALGQCYECNAPRVNSHRCAVHEAINRDLNRGHQLRRYVARRRAQCCVVCSRPSGAASLCAPCAIVKSLREARYRARRRAVAS